VKSGEGENSRKLLDLVGFEELAEWAGSNFKTARPFESQVRQVMFKSGASKQRKSTRRTNCILAIVHTACTQFWLGARIVPLIGSSGVCVN
jgi:hypothetical protein